MGTVVTGDAECVLFNHVACRILYVVKLLFLLLSHVDFWREQVGVSRFIWCSSTRGAPRVEEHHVEELHISHTRV
jgi:hypothetical protein